MQRDLFDDVQRVHHDPDSGGLDRFYTPDRVALVALQNIALNDESLMGHASRPVLMIDPAVGGGSWPRGARQLLSHLEIIGVDLDPNAAGFSECDEAIVGDWLQVAPTLADRIKGRRVLIATNGPFSIQGQFTAACMELVGDRHPVHLLVNGIWPTTTKAWAGPRPHEIRRHGDYPGLDLLDVGISRYQLPIPRIPFDGRNVYNTPTPVLTLRRGWRGQGEFHVIRWKEQTP